MQNITICLDPGHGGEDPGTGGFGVLEKEMNLSIAISCKNILEKEGIRVVMTRAKDEFIGLKERTVISNKQNAEVFCSIHCNGAKNINAYGFETYHFPYSLEGLKLANCVHKSVVNKRELVRSNRGVKKAKFKVLKDTYCPSILVEVGFLTNKEDSRIITSNKETFGRKIAEGIISYLFPERNFQGTYDNVIE